MCRFLSISRLFWDISAAAILGARDVTVSTPGGTSAALVGGFTVTAPPGATGPTGPQRPAGKAANAGILWVALILSVVAIALSLIFGLRKR